MPYQLFIITGQVVGILPMYDTSDFARCWGRAWQVQHFLTFSLLSHFALPLSAGRVLLFLTRYQDAAVTQSC